MGRSAKRDSTADRDDERPQLTLDLSAFSEPVSWRAHSKPPNYPTRRSEAAAAATSSSNYNTFTPSDAPRFGLGLSMAGARRKLLATIERKIEEKERSTNFTKEFRDPFSLLLVLCAVFRFLDYSRSTNDCDYELFEGFFLLTAAILNGLLNATQRRRHHDEIAERVRVAITAMAARKVEQVPMYWNPLLSRSGDSSKSAALLPSTSYVACYRDNQWHRLPMNLLVEGDVIALMSGDVAPGEVRLVDIEADHDRAEIHKACIFPRGFKIPSTGSTGESTRCNATFNPLLLLSLCGQMRLFEMMETPVLRDIEDSFFRINRPDTFTQKLQAKARLVAIYVCTMYSVFVLVAIGLRVVFQHRSLYTALNHLLLGPIGIWLCFASLNTPFVLFLAEAIATASILGSFEAILRPKTQHGNDSMDCDSPTKSKLEPEHEESDFRSTQPVSTAEDIYDFEEREKIRSEHASKQSALLRTWRYLLVTLKFRSRPSASAHGADHVQLPVPFRCFRLLERLGSTTMLCCFDDDILCEQSPSVEEIFLLSDKTGHPTVLDLHPERGCDTGLKFEDPKWKQHLPSLKSIGLAILLNDANDPITNYQTSLKYLQNESFTAEESAIPGVRDPVIRSCLQRLSAHVRMLPFPKHLTNLSREIGFVAEDLEAFQRLRAIQIISPRLAHHEHTIDHHDQGQEDSRYRGNLKTHLYSTVVLDKRTNRHQLLSRGHPAIALTQCSEYWDGKSMCPLTAEKRRSILDMYNQWRVEDLDCVALTFAPVMHKSKSLFPPIGPTSEPLPPIYLVEDSSAGEMTVSDEAPGEEKREKVRLQPSISPVASNGSADDRKDRSEHDISSSHNARPVSPASQKIRGVVNASEVASSAGIYASETGSAEKDSLLWRIQNDQIFLGMVATGVQPKRTIPDFIEDLTASGIRFVYFSPRNMRRSKLLAEKMGIETDWNCAISLRPLDSDRPDPHRMTSNYSDWDVKARLPHGVDAIKRHLEEVDNVPLLVSLYTDSTPETISEMISIFQENNEVVLGVGSSLKESNAMLFSKADLSVALEGSLRTYFDDALPNGSGLPVFSQEDVELSHILNTLACSFRIKSQVADDDHPSLTNMIELIRLGRSVLTNFHQMCSFIFVSQLFLATVILSAYIVPFPLVPQLSCASIFWLLWVLVPALSLSMLGSPAEKDVMKRTPRKNEDLELNEDLPRLTIYFLLRHVPSALVSIVAFECLMGFSLEDSTDRLDTAYQGFRWVDFVLHSSLVLEHPRPPVVAAAIDRAEAGMILVLALSILASSCGYLYRCESILQASPTRNRAWVCTVTALLCAQLVMCIVRAGVTGADGKTLWHFIYDIVPWYFWVGVFVWPIIVVVVDEMVKAHDRRHLTRYYKFLRMQFDTRLGMWSPK